MSKELKKAWNGLLDDITMFDGFLTDKGKKDILDKIDVIKSYLTPPTQEEVCKALSEYFEDDIILNPATNEFMNTDCFANSIDTSSHIKVTEWFEPYDNYSIMAYLPHGLIILIGRFYEGESK